MPATHSRQMMLSHDQSIYEDNTFSYNNKPSTENTPKLTSVEDGFEFDFAMCHGCYCC